MSDHPAEPGNAQSVGKGDLTLRALELDAPSHHTTVAELWNAACGPNLAITPTAVCFNTRPTTGAIQAGRMALVRGQMAGFVLASAFSAGDPAVSPRELGWIDAIAVHPHFQRYGIGSALLAWAEDWLMQQGCARFRLGGSLRPFAPGLPSELGSEGFFRHRGYAHRSAGARDWDVACDLRSYESPPSVHQCTGSSTRLPDQVRSAQPGDENALLAFLTREFPGRWYFECQEHLRSGGRISDYQILVIGTDVEGFCQLTFEDSLRPLDRFFMHGLARPWGQLGPIGVGRLWRGSGYGVALLDAGLRRLRDTGVAGCIIDWTSLLDFYGKFGFRPHRQYEILLKV